MGLPLRMNNLHAPTVSSGPTSAAAASNGRGSPPSLAALQRQKDELEAELKALGGVLDSHGVNMDTPLLTRDGFPRADVDVAQIRTTRARIIRLRNDYKDVMSSIEKCVHMHFASLDDANDLSAPGSGAQLLSSDAEAGAAAREPFAKINTVSPGSPAERSGLRPGDEIRVFGYVDRDNHDGLKKVAECVQGNEGRDVFIRVSRPTGAAQRQELRLTLRPTRDWGGRGLLGCHILPL
ncbi:hypothetical protein CDD83_7845 [Cordyceps sp. RAO-2017]|nr:hypothetical protein CDD83_7845 [Cordyceps sp. RAO-2017]